MSSSDWIDTATHNRISKKSRISGSDKIVISGHSTIHPKVTLKGDVPLLSNANTTISLGKYCYLKPQCSIIPPIIKQSLPEDGGQIWYGTSNIGAYTIIGSNSTVQSASIGNRVIIEDNCMINNLAIIYDCCIIRENTIIPENVVIPPYSEVKGIPGKDYCINHLNPSYKALIELEAKQLQILGTI